MSTTYDTILVPTDGSENAAAAAGHALSLAGEFDAAVHVLHVIDTRRTEGLLGSDAEDAGDPRDEGAEEAAERASGGVTEAIEELAADAGRTPVVEVRAGVPHATILAYAAEHGVDLISLGASGHTGLDRYLVGSTAERVVRLSDVPVLTVPADETDASYDRILVPTDGSEGATHAAEHAVTIAERYGATLHVVSVVNLVEEGGYFSAGGVSDEFVDRLDAAAREWIDELVATAEDAGLATGTDVIHGTPSAEIVGYAADHDIDLVVMGTHGRTGLDRYLVGSVTEHVLRSASVPLLTVRRPAE